MKYLFSFLTCTALLLVSCTSCHKKDLNGDACSDPSCYAVHDSTLVDSGPSLDADASDVSEDVPNLDSSKTLTFKGKSWELTVPSAWEPITPATADSSIELAVVNKEEKSLVSIITEPFNGTEEAYLLQTVRGLKDTQAVVVENKKVDVNGKKMFYLASTKVNISMWMWVTTHNKKGYVLSCGTPKLDSSSEKECFEIAQSLKFN